MLVPIPFMILILLLLLLTMGILIKTWLSIRDLFKENAELHKKVIYWQRRYNIKLSESQVKVIRYTRDKFEAITPGELAECIVNDEGRALLN